MHVDTTRQQYKVYAHQLFIGEEIHTYRMPVTEPRIVTYSLSQLNTNTCDWKNEGTTNIRECYQLLFRCFSVKETVVHPGFDLLLNLLDSWFYVLLATLKYKTPSKTTRIHLRVGLSHSVCAWLWKAGTCYL